MATRNRGLRGEGSGSTTAPPTNAPTTAAPIITTAPPATAVPTTLAPTKAPTNAPTNAPTSAPLTTTPVTIRPISTTMPPSTKTTLPTTLSLKTETPAPTQTIATPIPSEVEINSSIATPTPSLLVDATSSSLKQYVVPSVIGAAVVVFFVILVFIRKRRKEDPSRYNDTDVLSPIAVQPNSGYKQSFAKGSSFDKDTASTNVMRNTNVDSQLDTRTSAYDYNIDSFRSDAARSAISNGSRRSIHSSLHGDPVTVRRSQHSSLVEDPTVSTASARASGVMPPAATTCDPRLLHQRARKKRNSQAWRQKQIMTKEALRQQIVELEKTIAGMHIVLATCPKRGHIVEISRKYTNLMIEKEYLIRENAMLHMALERRDMFVRAIQPAIPRFDMSDPRIQDDMFLFDHIQRVLREVTNEIPSALALGSPTTGIVNGWRAVFIEKGLHLTFKLERSVGPLHLDDIGRMSEYHWSQRNQKETYLNINKNCADFTVIRQPQRDLSVVEIVLKTPSVVRVMIQFQVYLANGFDYCMIHLSPDLSRVTTHMIISVRVVDGQVVTTTSGRGTAVVELPHPFLMNLVVSQLTQWENVLRNHYGFPDTDAISIA
ncbi:hypothetical protein THRCLA_00672 [Thraustotheca clavata]|uniref:Uncharacterized protein n=1 Tax=Thraustotheca clavata TaxID=74557 RepID=A0A1W0AAU4_9STRA|nr:hypothetical protein THRCLA_00672 [Thraustotheca clavata]